MFFSMIMMMMMMLSLQFCRNFSKMEIVVDCWREWWRRRRRRRRISLVKEGEDSWVPFFFFFLAKASLHNTLHFCHDFILYYFMVSTFLVGITSMYICLRICWAKKMCHWRTYEVGNVPSPFIQMNVGNNIQSHHLAFPITIFCSITQPIGVGCYPPSWLSSLWKEMWAFTTHEGDLRFYTIPCRCSRFHHMCEGNLWLHICLLAFATNLAFTEGNVWACTWLVSFAKLSPSMIEMFNHVIV